MMAFSFQEVSTGIYRNTCPQFLLSSCWQKTPPLLRFNPIFLAKYIISWRIYYTPSEQRSTYSEQREQYTQSASSGRFHEVNNKQKLQKHPANKWSRSFMRGGRAWRFDRQDRIPQPPFSSRFTLRREADKGWGRRFQKSPLWMACGHRRISARRFSSSDDRE